MTDIDQFLAGSKSYPLIKINSEGGKVVGDLVAARLVDERDYDTGNIVHWSDGTPRKQIVLDIRIDWPASIDITTGKEGVNEEVGSYYCRFTAQLALREACETAGVPLSQVGRIAIARLKDGVPRNPRNKPPQQFRAEVARATAAAGVDSLLTAPLTADDI